MPRKITRRQARSWLAPMRSAFQHIRDTGCCESIKGYAVTRLHARDDYARLDYCCAGFRALLERLLPQIDSAPLTRIEKKLAAGTPLTVAEIDDAMRMFSTCETALLRFTRAEVVDAVVTEQIAIELDANELREAA